MAFVEEEVTNQSELVYFDDVESSSGWVGHTTSKSIQTLKSEIVSAISRLGGIVSRFVPGKSDLVIDGELIKRNGYRIEYSIETPSHKLIPGFIEIVALPVRDTPSLRRSYKTRLEKSMKMALYMAEKAIDGWWYMEKLSPGYNSLIPFMLVEGTKKTISQLWTEKNIYPQLGAPYDTFDGTFEEIQ